MLVHWGQLIAPFQKTDMQIPVNLDIAMPNEPPFPLLRIYIWPINISLRKLICIFDFLSIPKLYSLAKLQDDL